MEKWLRVEQIAEDQLKITFGLHNTAGYITDPIYPPGNINRFQSLHQKKRITRATWWEFNNRRFWQWPHEGE